MEKELTELFEAVKRAEDVADNSPGEEDRYVGALKQLKKFPVNYQVLVSTQVGKCLRQLTKHKSEKIGVLASDVVEMWRCIIVEETIKKKNGSISNGNSVNAEPASGVETNEHKKIQRANSIKAEQKCTAENVHHVKLETHLSLKVRKLKMRRQQRINLKNTDRST